MTKHLENKILNDGYLIINNAIDKKLISESKKIMINELKYITKSKNNSSLTDLFYSAKKKFKQHEIQVILAKSLVNANLIKKFLLQDKIHKSISSLIGQDLEYSSQFELAMNVKDISDEYLVKKYHQEFWSGVGINTLLLWIPINLSNLMGTIEIIKESHKWGHIPHQNREPTSLPKESKKIIIKAKEGSVVIMSAFTIHKTIPNKIAEPRIAIPLTVRNFYYPTTGNEDMWSFEKYNYSFYSKFRKILGNPQFSPFRTLNSDRKDFFSKEKILKK